MPVLTITSQIEAARIWAHERADAYRQLDEELAYLEEQLDEELRHLEDLEEDLLQNPYPDSPVYDDRPDDN